MRALSLLLHVALPLTGGAAIYLFWRPSTLLLFRWMAAVGIAGAAMSVRTLFMPIRDSIPRWIIFSLPQALWSYALLSFCAEVWRGAEGGGRQRRTWIAAALLVIFGSEAGQALSLVPGVFDLNDIYGCIGACSCALWRLSREQERKS